MRKIISAFFISLITVISIPISESAFAFDYSPYNRYSDYYGKRARQAVIAMNSDYFRYCKILYGKGIT